MQDKAEKTKNERKLCPSNSFQNRETAIYIRKLFQKYSQKPQQDAPADSHNKIRKRLVKTSVWIIHRSGHYPGKIVHYSGAAKEKNSTYRSLLYSFFGSSNLSNIPVCWNKQPVSKNPKPIKTRS